MRRLTTLIGALALVAAACSTGNAPTPTAVPATGTPAATATALATPTAKASALTLSARVTWDGQTCTYAGPMVVPRGAMVNFALANTPSALKGGLKGASLYVVPVEQGTTWEMITGQANDSPRPNVDDPPNWAFADQVRIMDVTATTGGTLGVPMTYSLYDVMCVTAEDGYVYPAALLKVLDS